MDQDGRDQTQLGEGKLAEAASDDVEGRLRRSGRVPDARPQRDCRCHRETWRECRAAIPTT